MLERQATAETLRRFLNRVFQELQRERLEIEPEEHRRLLAELLARAGGATHYELLGIPTDAQEAAIHASYRQLARLVHPCHASALGLKDQEGVLEVLFERATEAYLVLSDPVRRLEYDQVAAVDREPGRAAAVDPARRAEELRGVARDLLRRAGARLDREDRHFAVELLRQAVRVDPRAADAWALLGRVQMENPKWLHLAEDSLRRAARLQPDSADYRFYLAVLEERRDEREAAEQRYREVLELSPGHPAATEALERLRRNR